MKLALHNYDIAGAAMNAYKTIDDSYRATEKLNLERRAQDRADREAAENSQIRQIAIRKGLKQESDEAEAADIVAALHTGDLSKLSSKVAVDINKQLEDAGFSNETVLPRLKAATVLKPVIDNLAEQSKTWQQQAASGEGLQQADVVHLAQDPGYNDLRPYLKDLFFDKTRFNDKDGTPKLHQYEVDGKMVLGMVDQSDPVADVVFHRPTGKAMVSLNIKAVKMGEDGKPLTDKSGNYVPDNTTSIPISVATTGRSNAADDTISSLSLPELQQKTTELIKSGEAVMGIRRKALEAEYLRRSPVAREGVSKALAGRFENEQAWKAAGESPELNSLYSDPLLGNAMKNITTVTRAFGGSPKEALAKAQGVIEKAQTLAADKAEGQAFISTFSGIMEAAGKNPTSPYSGMTEFLKNNPALIGRKGAVDAVKAAQTAIASDRKNQTDQRRDELGWARVEALAARSSRTGASEETKAANLTKRDVATRIRDAQRQYATAVKTGDPATINEAIDNISYLNDQAKEIGVTLANVPAKRETAEETEVLRQQAVANLNTQRGAIGRFFNKSPNPKAVQVEMERLRKTGTKPASPTAQAAAAQQVSASPAQYQQQAGKALLSGNQVQVNGQSYPLNPDGTVTISGRKYRVQ